MSDKKDHVWLLIQEHVSDTMTRLGIGSLVSEMSLPIKEYERKVHGMSWQLVENWCLCKYCQMFDSNNLNYHHWSTELDACLSAINGLKLKNGMNRKKVLSRVLVGFCDFDNVDSVVEAINEKFNKESITDKGDILSVASEFVDGIVKLIGVLDGDRNNITTYMVNEFNMDWI